MGTETHEWRPVDYDWNPTACFSCGAVPRLATQEQCGIDWFDVRCHCIGSISEHDSPEGAIDDYAHEREERRRWSEG
jgi:hypothetical protein